MQTAEASLFKTLHVKPCIFAQLFDILSAVNTDISLADQMCQRHFKGIAEPPYCRRAHGHITQDQPAVRTENAVHAAKEILRIGIMMKALAADHRIKRVIVKRQLLAVTDTSSTFFNFFRFATSIIFGVRSMPV